MNSMSDLQSHLAKSRSSSPQREQKFIGPEAVRMIVKDAFTEFRGQEITDDKLEKFENAVFEGTSGHILSIEEAGFRITALIELAVT